MRRLVMVLVGSEPVMMLGMIVIDVGVRVQRGGVARRRCQDRAEQSGYQTLHSRSVCNPRPRVKPTRSNRPARLTELNLVLIVVSLRSNAIGLDSLGAPPAAEDGAHEVARA